MYKSDYILSYNLASSLLNEMDKVAGYAIERSISGLTDQPKKSIQKSINHITN